MSEDEVSDDPTWLLEPAGTGEVHFSLELGAGVELSTEGREALDTLMKEIHGREVEGFFSYRCPDDICSTKGVCSPYSCDLGDCRPESRSPCAFDYRCKITSA